MLPKQYRLPATIRLQRSATYSSPLFLCKIQKNDQVVSRFSFVVRKSLDKRATARNHMRRLFRSCIEQLLPQISEGYDFLFILNRGVLEIEREELYNTLYSFLKEKRMIA